MERRSKGSIVTQTELSWLAEAGYSESVIPLDGSAHAVSLWKQTGELWGVSQKSPFRQAADSLMGEAICLLDSLKVEITYSDFRRNKLSGRQLKFTD